MQNTLDRNTGTKKARGRENKRITRDRLIDRQLRNIRSGSVLRHKFGKEAIEPFSPYIGKVRPHGRPSVTKFPIRNQPNGRPQPQFKDLSRWFKLDLLALAMHEYGFVTFTVHIHPTLEQKWITEGKDPVLEMSVRMRKEIRKCGACPTNGWEYAFVIEGWGKQSQKSKDWSNPKQVPLHIHGFAAVYQDGDIDQLQHAIDRACGHGLKGYSKEPRKKANMKLYHHAGRTHTNYLLKYDRRKDDRLGYRRVVFSQTATQLAEEFWNTITGRDEEFWLH